MNKASYFTSSCYKFTPFSKDELPSIASLLHSQAKKYRILGLFILSTEGFNVNFSGSFQDVFTFKKKMEDIFKINPKEIFYKNQRSKSSPFFDLKVKVRDEIVSLNRKDFLPKSERPSSNKNSHTSKKEAIDSNASAYLSPKEWHQKLKNLKKNSLVLDIRNQYEVKLGKFNQALNLPISEFNEFPYALKKLHSERKKEFLIYCTGGIRCEKAALVMKEQGFKDALQLKGGILNYLSSHPYKEFRGECFVFDHRVAVNQDLEASQIYHICPHCGNPGKISITCVQCKMKGFICEECRLKNNMTCSKNCDHHFKQGHKTTRIHQESFKKRSQFFIKTQQKPIKTNKN